MRSLFLPTAACILFFAVTGLSQSQRTEGRVFWRGSVDDKVHLVIKGTTLESKTISGTEKPSGSYSFTAPLPALPVEVIAVRKEGRGTVTVIQQPAQDNGFTTIVEIYDNRGGARDYQLDISWKEKQ